MPSNLIRAGQFAQAARQGAIIVVALALPRLGVGREVIGEWESLLYVGYILGFGWLTGLLQAYLVQVRLIRPQEAAAFSRIAIIGVALFSAILLAVAAGLHRPLFSFLSMGEGPPGWWYFFLFLLTQWPGLFLEQVLTIRGKPLALVLFGGLSALGFTLALLVPLYLGAGFAHAMFVLATFAGVKGLVIVAWLIYDCLSLSPGKDLPSLKVEGRPARSARNLTPGPSPEERGDEAGVGGVDARSARSIFLVWADRACYSVSSFVGRVSAKEDDETSDKEDQGNIDAASNASNASNDGLPTTHYPLPTYFATLLKTAWPLILYASIGALVTAFDPWFVNYWYEGDESIFATFRYGARELPLLAAITNGAMVVVLPRLTEAPSAGLDLLKETSRRLFHWIFGGAIFLMATSGWWWTLVFTDLFAESLPLFQAYLFVVVSKLLFPMPIIVAMGRTRGLYLFSLSELLTKIVVCSIAAYYFGLVGIIFSIVFADVSNKLVLMFYVHHYMKIPPRRYMNVRIFGAYITLMAIVYAFVIM